MRVSRKLWDKNERWYRVGNRVAFYDSRGKNWIAHNVDESNYQVGDADYYGHVSSFLTVEPQFKAHDKLKGNPLKKSPRKARKKNPGSAAGFYVYRLDIDKRIDYLKALTLSGLIWGARMAAWIMPENKARDLARFAEQKDSGYMYGAVPAATKADAIRNKVYGLTDNPIKGKSVKKLRTRRGIYYFPTFESALEYAIKNGYPTARIINYEIGWAIQKSISGDYVGLKDKVVRKKNPVHAKLQWHTFGGGTGAAPGKNSYQTSQTDFGQYMIDPISWDNGRHRYFLTRFVNNRGARPGGLYQTLATGDVNSGKRIAREHYERISRGLEPVSELHDRVSKGGSFTENPIRKKNPVHEIRELVLYADNTGELQNQKNGIIQNLQRKIKRGMYDPVKAAKLWQYLIDNAVKQYNKEHGNGTYSLKQDIFTMADRKAAAAEMEAQYRDGMHHGEYDNNPLASTGSFAGKAYEIRYPDKEKQGNNHSLFLKQRGEIVKEFHDLSFAVAYKRGVNWINSKSRAKNPARKTGGVGSYELSAAWGDEYNNLTAREKDALLRDFMTAMNSEGLIPSEMAQEYVRRIYRGNLKLYVKTLTAKPRRKNPARRSSRGKNTLDSNSYIVALIANDPGIVRYVASSGVPGLVSQIRVDTEKHKAEFFASKTAARTIARRIKQTASRVKVVGVFNADDSALSIKRNLQSALSGKA